MASSATSSSFSRCLISDNQRMSRICVNGAHCALKHESIAHAINGSGFFQSEIGRCSNHGRPLPMKTFAKFCRSLGAMPMVRISSHTLVTIVCVASGSIGKSPRATLRRRRLPASDDFVESDSSNRVRDSGFNSGHVAVTALTPIFQDKLTSASTAVGMLSSPARMSCLASAAASSSCSFVKREDLVFSSKERSRFSRGFLFFGLEGMMIRNFDLAHETRQSLRAPMRGTADAFTKTCMNEMKNNMRDLPPHQARALKKRLRKLGWEPDAVMRERELIRRLRELAPDRNH